jgi:hypothetical protein
MKTYGERPRVQILPPAASGEAEPGLARRKPGAGQEREGGTLTPGACSSEDRAADF